MAIRLCGLGSHFLSGPLKPLFPAGRVHFSNFVTPLDPNFGRAVARGDAKYIGRALQVINPVDASKTYWLGAALLATSKEGRLGPVRALLNQGVNVNVQDDAGMTPLHQACWYGRAKVIEELLSGGADIHARCKNGYTALTYVAGAAGCVECGRKLIKAGSLINGTGALSWAAAFGHLPFCQLLITAGADVNEEGKDGFTPLEEAFRCEQKEVAQLLLKSGAVIRL